MVYKTNESIIVIQAEATSPNRTNVVFWSHDRGTAKLRMKLVRKDGIPQSLPEGTTVPIRLMFKSATAEGGYGKHDYLATIEDPVNGIVSIVLEDNILGYVGTVEGSVYIDFPNDRSLDTAGRFTFYIKRSPIDDSTPELEDYYFNGFSQTIDKIEKILADGKQEIDVKIKDTNDKITKANQDVATLNTNIEAQKEKFDAVSIYNKAEVDSKVADLDSVKADKTFVDAQLAETAKKSEIQSLVTNKADISYVDTKVQAANTAYKESYATLAALQAAYPTGDTFNHVVMADGMIYTWTKSAWTNTQIQANGTGIANKTITPEKLTFLPVEGIKSENLFTTEMEPGSISWGGVNENQYPDVMRSKGYISVVGGRNIAWKLFNGKNNDIQYFYLYDENYAFVKIQTVYGISSSFALPENVRYIRFRNAPIEGYVNPTPQFYKENMVIQYGESVARYISPKPKVEYSDILVPDRIDKNISPYTDTVFYCGVVRKTTDASANLILTFSQEDKRLIYRFDGVETILTLTQFEYVVPHNNVLVLNRNANALEIIGANSVVSGIHVILIRNHAGIPKSMNLRIENAYETANGASDTNSSIRLKFQPRRPLRKKKFTFAIDQDGTVVNDEIWLFTGNPSDHSNTANIYRVNRESWEEIGIIKHNLGHANAVDYLNDKLLVFNGGGYPPEINIYSNPVGKEQLNYTDTNNFQLIFKEGTKSLPGDGSACFGENEQIIYYFDNTKIHKILLGMGDNDLSDKTVEKTDVTRFGVYQTGKTITEYNGTAQVLKVYKGILNQQAQGMCYDGFLYLSTGFEFNHAFKVLLNDDAGTYEVVDDYRFNHFDYKGDRINIEAEVVFKDEGKVYVGARSATDSFLVSFEA
ncbi:BppU family phage baseplate upper protein [Enterococcus faecium]|nr:BppU family phage baseplate upper protein [Enterococcus faecium]